VVGAATRLQLMIREMSRLPISGASIVSPVQDEQELKRALSDLRVDHALGPAAAHEYYMRLGAIIGQWMSEQQQLEAATVAGSLLSMAKRLNEACVILDGLEPGLHSDLEISVASRIAQYLALEPGVKSLNEAQELLSSFRQQAARIAHVCMVARADLPDDGPKVRGRRALAWYDDFTALLLDMANKSGIQPTLRKDRNSGVRSGWLIEAAQALESFLWPEMRSPSAEACFKRLERSRRRLHDQHRQKGRAR
jgi:hypothetical protein